MNTRIVDTARQLEECCDSLAGADWITVDTEFMRERTYYPQLCLVQLGIPGQAWCVDALADLSLQPALELVCLQRSRRVLHAARQDLEIFFHLVGSFTSELFDTQIAAALLGFDAQIGYAGLVKELSGTELEKGYQRANWATRPLPSAQLEYALDDVRYLAELYPEILDRLGELGNRGQCATAATGAVCYRSSDCLFANRPDPNPECHRATYCSPTGSMAGTARAGA
jgi:ribonuclease D